jgi:hypothetical protein
MRAATRGKHGLLDHIQSRFFRIGFADRLFALAVAR